MCMHVVRTAVKFIVLQDIVVALLKWSTLRLLIKS